MAEKSVHGDHRKRMMEKFEKNGADVFSDHEMLEMMLFFSIPRRNTNEIAHRLLLHFGSLRNVMEARNEELCLVEGVGPRSAWLISFNFALFKRYQMQCAREKNSITKLNTVERIGQYFIPQFAGEIEEVLLAVYLDNSGRILRCDEIARGTAATVTMDTRRIIRDSILLNAAGVAMAHNHPNGDIAPSAMDIDATNRLETLLREVGIQLVDHVVVAGSKYASIFQLRRSKFTKGFGD